MGLFAFFVVLLLLAVSVFASQDVIIGPGEHVQFKDGVLLLKEVHDSYVVVEYNGDDIELERGGAPHKIDNTQWFKLRNLVNKQDDAFDRGVFSVSGMVTKNVDTVVPEAITGKSVETIEKLLKNGDSVEFDGVQVTLVRSFGKQAVLTVAGQEYELREEDSYVISGMVIRVTQIIDNPLEPEADKVRVMLKTLDDKKAQPVVEKTDVSNVTLPEPQITPQEKVVADEPEKSVAKKEQKEEVKKEDVQASVPAPAPQAPAEAPEEKPEVKDYSGFFGFFKKVWDSIFG